MSESIVKARCSRESGNFAIVFVKRSAEMWEATRTYRMSEEPASTGYGDNQFVLVGIAVGFDYSGCPFCGNQNFILCGACGTLNCQGLTRREKELTYVWCAKCQLWMYLEGVIKQLTAHGGGQWLARRKE